MKKGTEQTIFHTGFPQAVEKLFPTQFLPRKTSKKGGFLKKLWGTLCVLLKNPAKEGCGKLLPVENLPDARPFFDLSKSTKEQKKTIFSALLHLHFHAVTGGDRVLLCIFCDL